jgi:hypothetical protein
VADEDKVCLHSIGRDRSGGIPCEKGINNDFISVRLESEGGMSIPGELKSHTSLLFSTV